MICLPLKSPRLLYPNEIGKLSAKLLSNMSKKMHGGCVSKCADNPDNPFICSISVRAEMGSNEFIF